MVAVDHSGIVDLEVREKRGQCVDRVGSGGEFFGRVVLECREVDQVAGVGGGFAIVPRLNRGFVGGFVDVAEDEICVEIGEFGEERGGESFVWALVDVREFELIFFGVRDGQVLKNMGGALTLVNFNLKFVARNQAIVNYNSSPAVGVVVNNAK